MGAGTPVPKPLASAYDTQRETLLLQLEPHPSPASAPAVANAARD